MHYWTLREIAQRLREGDVTSTEVTESLLGRIADIDGELNSFSVVVADQARAAAQQRDAELRSGHTLGPLHGVPIAVKDLFGVLGTPSAAGTTALADVIASRDATVVQRLRDAGAVIVGKLKMSEGAFAAHHPDLGTPRNPWGADLWIGASSSGSAAATAAGLTYATLGSDTGGSIRFPSAAAGLSGLKPTWGRVSRAGSVEFCGSLDTVGPMARNAYDCAIVHDVISGPDSADPVTFGWARPALVEACHSTDQITARSRIGIDRAFLAVCDDETRAVILQSAKVFASLGAEIVDVTLPAVDQMIEDWTPACAVEASIVHEEAYLRDPHAYGEQMRSLIATGLQMRATDFQGILARRGRFAGEMRAALTGVDAVLLQVTGMAGPSASYLDEIGVGPVWRDKIMMATCPINAAGLPAMTIPGGRTERGTPIGFQLVGGPDSEPGLIALAHAFQTETSHHLAHPPLYA